MAIKFNDYFEFPRELDMSPYTAATLAEKEGISNLLHDPYNFKAAAMPVYAMWHCKVCHYVDTCWCSSWILI